LAVFTVIVGQLIDELTKTTSEKIDINDKDINKFETKLSAIT
jgi:hypothetical protein